MQTVVPINPFYAARQRPPASPAPALQGTQYAKLPRAPITASPVPHLTSLYHFDCQADAGKRAYPGNCGGGLIRDLLRFYRAMNCYDPMTGSGTCQEVCRELGIYCWSGDLRTGFDACAQTQFNEAFQFAFLHPPYWRQKVYSDHPLDLSAAPTLDAFLERYDQLLRGTARALLPNGKLVVLMGDYIDRAAGYCSLTFHTKRLAFAAGLRQECIDIIRFSHGASSSSKVYRTSFIPMLHDVCMVFEKTA